jgi:hypothetical protein
VSGIPLAVRLKKRSQRTLALAQDLAVMEVFDAFPGSILHGGTAIWRCYGGQRFSEAVDFYFPRLAQRDLERLAAALSAKGLSPSKAKVTQASVFAKFHYAGEALSIEGLVGSTAGREAVPRQYEMLDGARMLVGTLAPEGLLVEKAAAYLSRAKVRDLYDVFFLATTTGPGTAHARERVSELLSTFRPPVDERQLRSLVISGVAPSVKAMTEALRAWAG